MRLRCAGPLDNQRGVALLLTLVVLVLLTAVIVEFDYGAKINLITAGNFRDEARATYLAKAGVTAARAVLKEDAKGAQSSKFDALTEFWARPFPPYPVGEGFVSVEITDEGGKIDLNRLAEGGAARDDTKTMLRLLFTALELEPDQIETIVESLEDWVDQDDSSGFNGAEDSYYLRLNPSYRCKNAPMDTISELRLVNGVTPEIYRKIRPYLTTVSIKGPGGVGTINVNTAEPPVLQALDKNINTDTATCIQNQRPYENWNQFFGCANASSACQAGSVCKKAVGFASGFFKAKSHGIMHETEKIVTAVIQKSDLKLISWQIE